MAWSNWEVITTDSKGRPYSVESHAFPIRLPHRASDEQLFNVLRREGHITRDRYFGEMSPRTNKRVYSFRRAGGKVVVLFHGKPEYILQRTLIEGSPSWVHYSKRRGYRAPD